MKSRIGAFFVRLSRLHHSCGFGVQSPTDYAFIREVINEHSPYYSYGELGSQDDWLTRKLGRLYFRIANWRRPRVIDSDRYRDYMQKGCGSVSFGESDEMIHVYLPEVSADRLPYIYNNVRESGVLIVEGINENNGTRRMWHEIVADERTGVTFDLYYCGIVFFDKSRYKANYIVNF